MFKLIKYKYLNLIVSLSIFLLSNTVVNSREIVVTRDSDISVYGMNIGFVWNANYTYIGNRTYEFTTFYDHDDLEVVNFGMNGGGTFGNIYPSCYNNLNNSWVWGECSDIESDLNTWAVGFTLNIHYIGPPSSKVRLYFSLSETEANYCTSNYQELLNQIMSEEDDEEDGYGENNEDDDYSYGTGKKDSDSELSEPCYLRYAIEIATEDDIIIIDPRISNYIEIYEGYIDIDKNVSIKGYNSPSVFGYNGLFNVLENGVLDINNITIGHEHDTCCPDTFIKNEGGDIYFKNSIIKNVFISEDNVMILVESGNIFIENSEFINSGKYNNNGCILEIKGEGLVNSTVKIISSIFHDNRSNEGYGTAIMAKNNYSMNIDNTIFSENSANQGGGGIWAEGGYLNINNCLFERNSARNGGALHLLRVLEYNGNNNTWRENYAELGGAIYNDESYITSELPLFQNNIVVSSAGAIYNLGQLKIIGGLFENNQGGMNNIANIFSESRIKYKIVFVSTEFINGDSFFNSAPSYSIIESCNTQQTSNISIWGCSENLECLDKELGYDCVCGQGTYQIGDYRNLTCIPCELGTYCNGFGNTNAKTCPIGAYCTASEAFICPVGYYCESRNIIEPVKCENELLCPIGTTKRPNLNNSNRLIIDIENDAMEYLVDKNAVEYDNSQISNTNEWNNQLVALIWTVIISTLIWVTLVFLFKYYKQNSKYLDLIKDLDFFPTKHRVDVGNYVKSNKTIWGGAITLLWVLSILFMCWFYSVRYKYNNSEIFIDHLTNETIKSTSEIYFKIELEGGISIKDIPEPFDISIKKGIASSSHIHTEIEYVDQHKAIVKLGCSNCIFDEYQIIINVCSKNNETFINRIGWEIKIPSFRKGRIARTYGVYLPRNRTLNVWKNNGLDLPIINLFLKPIRYINTIEEEEGEGFTVEYQERYYGSMKSECNFFSDSNCNTTDWTDQQNTQTSQSSQSTTLDISDYISDYLSNMCTDKTQTGFQIMLNRPVGLYKISVNKKFMAMDMLAELFAMIGACTSAMILFMVVIESYQVLKEKYKNGHKINIFKTLCCADQCCDKDKHESDTQLKKAIELSKTSYLKSYPNVTFDNKLPLSPLSPNKNYLMKLDKNNNEIIIDSDENKVKNKDKDKTKIKPKPKYNLNRNKDFQRTRQNIRMRIKSTKSNRLGDNSSTDSSNSPNSVNSPNSPNSVNSPNSPNSPNSSNTLNLNTMESENISEPKMVQSENTINIKHNGFRISQV